MSSEFNKVYLHQETLGLTVCEMLQLVLNGVIIILTLYAGKCGLGEKG